MKAQIVAVALFVGTAATVALYPTPRSVGAVNPPVVAPVIDPLSNQRSQIEVVFVLDTTGSMGGLIQSAKEKIWSIASTMASAQPAPEIRIGLVAYRDRGDDYVTRIVDLSEDLDSMYATLMDLQAEGGGDGPESVNQALDDAVNAMSWSQDPNSYKVVFLVGDAPPHMDYQNDVKYPRSLATATTKGIVVNAIQCGRDPHTSREWQQIAQLGQGRYFQVEQAGSAVAIATPFDDELAELSRDLDATRLYYGNSEEKEKRERKLASAAKLHRLSSVASLARRAAYNATESGAANLFGEGELVEDVTSGRVELLTMDPETLPAPMQTLAPEEQQLLISATAEKRGELQRQIRALTDQRADYLAAEVKTIEGAESSLDHQIYRAVREQAGTKGLRYEEDALTY